MCAHLVGTRRRVRRLDQVVTEPHSYHTATTAYVHKQISTAGVCCSHYQRLGSRRDGRGAFFSRLTGFFRLKTTVGVVVHFRRTAASYIIPASIASSTVKPRKTNNVHVTIPKQGLPDAITGPTKHDARTGSEASTANQQRQLQQHVTAQFTGQCGQAVDACRASLRRA